MSNSSVSTTKIESEAVKDAVHEKKSNPGTQEEQKHEAFLSVFDRYDIDSLTHYECVDIAKETNRVIEEERSKHQLYLEYCSDCELLHEYKNFSEHELKNLTEQDDLGAIHEFVYRKLRSTEDISELASLISKAIARGSIPLAGEVSKTLYNIANNDSTLSESERIEFKDKATMYEAFIQFRLGRLNPEQYHGEEADKFKAFIREMEEERKEMGLGKFINFDYPEWPENFQDKCDQLDTEHYNLYHEQ